MEASLVVSDDGDTMSARPYLRNLLEDLIAGGFADPTSPYIHGLNRIADGAPTSAERQRAVYEQTRSFDAVTRALADEFEADVLAGVGSV
jgi:hypothetical protein